MRCYSNVCGRNVDLGDWVPLQLCRVVVAGTTAASEVRQGRATDRSNLRVTRGPLARRPICLSSIIESNGVGDSTRLNKIFHICAIVNLACHNNNLFRWISLVTDYE